LKFPFFIAKRYVRTRRTHTAVAIISRISLVGVSVGAMTLIIVLSVFNGFESLVVSLFNAFDPDIRIEKVEGKHFHLEDFPHQKIKEMEGVKDYSLCLEEIALLTYGQKQQIVSLKGVEKHYAEISDIDKMLLRGNFILNSGDIPLMVLGLGTEYSLSISVNDKSRPISVYAPDRTKSGGNISSAFVSDYVLPAGVFSVQEEFDNRYVFVPFDFVQDLYKYSDEVSYMEVFLEDKADVQKTKNAIKKLLGDSYYVKDRLEQQEFIYKIMKSEKWAVFMILGFILLIASFNVIGTLSMLIIEKKKDIFVMQSLGASLKDIRRIFLIQGSLMIFLGGLIGVFVGGIICWLQQEFELIGFATSGNFVVSSYPVKMIWIDFVFVTLLILLIGVLSSLYPVMKINRKFFTNNEALKSY